MAKRDIGIKNSFKIYQAFLTAAFVAFVVLTIIFWIFYRSDNFIDNLYYNGIEVEAEIIDYYCTDATPDSTTSSSYVYEGVYLYVSPEGKEYSGTRVLGGSEKAAQAMIGTKITIIIDPNGTDSTDSSMKYLFTYHGKASFHFTLACVFTGLLCIATYLFFYRVVYRNRLDKKILERANGRFVSNCVREGEVTKVLKWVVCYVKVKYQDESGTTRERWARAWFTHKEVRFLQEKKTITIVPYKNTYGILEEMQY